VLPVGHLRQPAQAAGEYRPLSDRSFQPLLAHGDVETGLTQRGRQRAEGVPDQRFRSHAAAALVEILRRRRATELCTEVAELFEQLLPRDVPAR
jgi:hypothetical protein